MQNDNGVNNGIIQHGVKEGSIYKGRPIVCVTYVVIICDHSLGKTNIYIYMDNILNITN